MMTASATVTQVMYLGVSPTAARVRNQPRNWLPVETRVKAVSPNQFNGRQGRRHRQAEMKDLAVVDEDLIACFLESGGREIDEVAIPKGDVEAAAVQRFNALPERRVEALRRREPCAGNLRERPEGNAWRRLRARRRRRRAKGDCTGDERSQTRDHRARPSPRNELRASMRPYPNRSSRPGAPRSIANFSMAASIAAGAVMPCCIIMAATPVTCGVAIDVPM